MIRRLLVANRGEIALRIFRTCRARGIEPVAVATPDDLGSLHARSADATAMITSYLDPAEYLRAAREHGIDAVHPGYGFLAESSAFAEAVAGAGLTWVGPPARALALGGDKLAAKRIAIEAGVPTLPQGEPDEVGLPLVVKAAAAAACGSSALRASSTPPSQPPGARRRQRSVTRLCSASAISSARATSRCRSSPTPSGTWWSSASATARCSAAIKRSSRRRRRPTSAPRPAGAWRRRPDCSPALSVTRTPAPSSSSSRATTSTSSS